MMGAVERKEKVQGLAGKVESLTNELLICYEELDFIYESGNVLASLAKGEIDGWKGAAGSILDNAVEVLEADFGWIYFIEEEEGEKIEVEEARGLDAAKAVEISLLFGPQVKTHMAMVHLPINENQFGSNPAAVIFAPFKSGEKLFGAIALGKSDGSDFSSHHMKLISHFSDYSAQVFENVKMFHEIKRAYQLSQEANKKLEKLNRMKESLIAVTSHELKTPLSILFMCLDLIKNDDAVELSGSRKDIVEMMECGIKKLDIIVRNICIVSRIEGGKFSMRKKRFCLSSLVEEILQSISFVFKKRRVGLQVEIADRLEIFGDRGMVGNVISELIMNAVKHTPDGGSIKITGAEEKGGTVLKVDDSGAGLPEEDKDHIFDKFHRVGEHMQHSSGTYEFKTNGICVGLAMSKSIVEAHEGRIWVENLNREGTAEKGCRFAFFLPHSRGKACTAIVEKSSGEKGPVEVEDERTVRQVA